MNRYNAVISNFLIVASKGYLHDFSNFYRLLRIAAALYKLLKLYGINLRDKLSLLNARLGRSSTE